MKHLRILFLSSILLLNFIGCILIYSLEGLSLIFIKHIFCLILGWCIMFFVSKKDYKIWGRVAPFLWIFSICLLIIVLFFVPIRGTKGWIHLGIFSLQPSEIAKFATVLLLVEYLSSPFIKEERLKKVMVSSLFVLLPVFLILLQPDVGGILIFFPLYFLLLYLSNVSLFFILLLIVISGLIGILTIFLLFLELYYQKELNFYFFFPFLVILWIIILSLLRNLKIIALGFSISVAILFATSIKDHLKLYQKKRLVVFLNPQIDSQNIGYHIIQSKIAIGSGKIFGRGLDEATQSRLGFLPEASSDFIFSFIGESFGFLGCWCVLLLYLILGYICFKIASLSNTSYSKLLVSGLGSLLLLQVILNVGICLSIFPTVGLSLPLISYGGTNLIISLLSCGIILSLFSSLKRNKNSYTLNYQK